MMSWGHDEYMASVLERNRTHLPPDFIYLVRYHSFYAWHSPEPGHARGYTRFANEKDWRLLPLLKLFQSADLYSKVSSEDDRDSAPVKAYYDRLIDTYLPQHNTMVW